MVKSRCDPFPDLRERSSYGAIRPPCLTRDLRELRSLQPQLKHAPGERIALCKNPLSLIGQSNRRVRADLRRPFRKRTVIASIEWQLEVDGTTVSPVVPHLLQQFVLCYRCQEPPEVARAPKREPVVTRSYEKAPIDRHDDVFRIDSGRQPCG
jgi:hypothetical protein